MSDLSSSFCFVDLETTGGSAQRDRIIEIAILTVRDGEVIDEYQTLVNPEGEISSFIQNYTGITNEHLRDAPTFAQIAREVHERLSGKIFVAHNVRFDYSFLKNEFLRFGLRFSTKQICTVKLSRRLFPQHRRHSLDAIIERHGIDCSARHRAMGDAQVMFDFWRLAERECGHKTMKAALDQIAKRPSVPMNIPEEKLQTLPDACGVYVFYGAQGAPLYVGKSVNIRSRVLSHFSGDHVSGKEMRIAQQIADIEYFETPGELSALLLESKLVKDWLPIYNHQLRRTHKYLSYELSENEAGYQNLKLIEASQSAHADWTKVYGVFRSKREATSALEVIAEAHGLCHRYLGLEKTHGACFAFQLKKCRGACVGEEPAQLHNLRLQTALLRMRGTAWPFDGMIGIREHDQARDLTAIHVVNNWCILGTAHSDGELEELLKSPPQPVFDRDSYKLLLKFLAKKGSGLQIIKNLGQQAAATKQKSFCSTSNSD